jgi:hypothetical protein
VSNVSGQLALMLIHAIGDLLPNFADFIKTWQF